MATRAVAFTATFMALDSATGRPKTGDSANITARKCKDGTSSALTSGTVTEVDATNMKGLYKVSLDATEADCDELVVGGVSSTSGIDIVPTTYQMERLPNAVPGAAGGVFIAGTNAATTVTTSFTTTFTGNLTGSVASVSGAVGSVTGAVGSVTGAVGSVTGNVGGNVTGSVGSVSGNVGGNVTGSVGSVVGAVGSVTGLTASDVGAIKTTTDKFAFTVANQVDSNVLKVGGTTQSAGDLYARLLLIDGKTTNLPSDPADESLIIAATDAIVALLPTALVGGRINASVGAMAADTLTSSALATDAAQEIADALLDRASAIEGYTVREALRLVLVAAAAKLSGAATTTVKIRDIADSKDRITATVDASGNRTAITLDAT